MPWLSQPLMWSAIRVAWLMLALFWIWSSRAGRLQEAAGPQGSRDLPFNAWMAAGIILLLKAPGRFPNYPLFSETPPVRWCGLMLVCLGILLAVWARLQRFDPRHAAGANGKPPELIQSGPYRAIRHPVYAGLSLSLLGIVLAVDRVHAVAGWLILVAGYLWKSREEDRALTLYLGDTFREYARRTRALIPWVY